MKKLTNDEMRAMTSKFRQRIENGETLDAILPEAFALVTGGLGPDPGHAAFRRADDGRHRAAPGEDHRDEDR